MMKRTALVAVAILFIANSAQGRDISQSQISSITPASVGASIAAMPLPFTKNEGQWPDSILYRTNAGGATMWFTKNGIYYQFFRKVEKTKASATAIDPVQDALGTMPDKFDNERDSIETTMIKAEFVGASEEVEVVALQELEYKCNYFLGNEPSKWRADVPNFSAVTLKGIYPGIDIRFSSDANNRATYEFITTPAADLSQVKVAYEGGEATPNAQGKLVVNSIWGEMMEAMTLPTTTTTAATLLVNRSIENPTRAGMSDAGDASSPNSALGLAYSTYLGGGFDDFGNGIAVDASGNAFVVGYTSSTNFPILNPYQTNQASEDVSVTKLSSAGNSLIYSTYLGGNSADDGAGIAVDASGNAFVTGYTFSTNFPTLNAYQIDPGDLNQDAFVTKLSSTGNSLIYSTYLGGGLYENGSGIAVDASGNAFVTGLTFSTDFPTLNPYQTNQLADDIFVTKLNSTGDALIYSTYLGGDDSEYGHGIAVDASGNAFVTGRTSSTNFPTLNPYQTDPGDGTTLDVFVTKLSSTGNSLIYSTYLGGSGSEYGFSIAVDASGNAFVTGYTLSTNFPTLNPYQTEPGDGTWDAYVTKLSSAGNSLIYSTYLGGNSEDIGWGIAVDASGNAFVAGSTLSTNFPTFNSYQTHLGDVYQNTFVTKLCSTGNSLIYSTYLGGNDIDVSRAIALDPNGSAFVTGFTKSEDFPVLTAYQAAFVDGYESFVTKLGGDSDGDSEPDGTDNCHFHFNPSQEDFDDDGKGDSCSMPSYLSPLTIVARYAPPIPPSPPNPPGDPNVNLRVIDPDGLYIGADSVGNTFNIIGGSANYFQITGNDSIVIVDPKSGEYTIEVIPETDANTGDKYLVGIRIDGTVELIDQAKLVPNEGERDTVFVNNVPYAFGDGDGDRSISIGDAVFIINYIFLGGVTPIPIAAADADCDGSVTIGDAVHLIGYIFLGGEAPGCP